MFGDLSYLQFHCSVMHLVKRNPHLPPGHMEELILTGVKTEKVSHPMGTLFVNIHKVWNHCKPLIAMLSNTVMSFRKQLKTELKNQKSEFTKSQIEIKPKPNRNRYTECFETSSLCEALYILFYTEKCLVEHL